jgi:hypothetical protein
MSLQLVINGYLYNTCKLLCVDLGTDYKIKEYPLSFGVQVLREGLIQLVHRNVLQREAE